MVKIYNNKILDQEMFFQIIKNKFEQIANLDEDKLKELLNYYEGDDFTILDGIVSCIVEETKPSTVKETFEFLQIFPSLFGISFHHEDGSISMRGIFSLAYEKLVREYISDQEEFDDLKNSFTPKDPYKNFTEENWLEEYKKQSLMTKRREIREEAITRKIDTRSWPVKEEIYDRWKIVPFMSYESFRLRTLASYYGLDVDDWKKYV